MAYKDATTTMLRRHTIRATRRKEWVEQRGGRCVNCGETTYELLEVDHIHPNTKLYRVCTLWNSLGQPYAQAELAKCQVLCRSCHLTKSIREGSLATFSNTKLSNDQIIEIREMYATGSYTQTKLGVLFGVSQHTIWCIVHRKSWIDL
jgi:hypothetical protein